MILCHKRTFYLIKIIASIDCMQKILYNQNMENHITSTWVRDINETARDFPPIFMRKNTNRSAIPHTYTATSKFIAL